MPYNHELNGELLRVRQDAARERRRPTPRRNALHLFLGRVFRKADRDRQGRTMISIGQARDTALRMERRGNELAMLAAKAERHENARTLYDKAIEALAIAEQARETCQLLAAETAPWN